MLNRLFIAIGILVILAIGAAFIVPRFIQWGDYRERLEAIASETLGTPVTITGDIQLDLLPTPKLSFSDVVVGAPETPALRVKRVVAEVGLTDFIRDQYHISKLDLEGPELTLSIGADGKLASTIALAETVSSTAVSVASANITGGAVQLSDARSGKSFSFAGVNGEVRLEALRGPFSFSGVGTYGSTAYAVRIGTGALDADGATNLTLYLKGEGDGFTINTTGALQTAGSPRYTGALEFRQPPPKPAEGEVEDAGRGDFVVTGTLDAALDRIVLSNNTVSPDENRPGTRLTGAAELLLGAAPKFNAVISGGVIALPPRDATAEGPDPPYELVRLLGETPLPVLPGIPGTLGLDIAELNLRATTLRGLELDATSDGERWSIGKFKGTLPGGTSVGLSGDLTVVNGRPSFAGKVSLASERLDLLAALWRKPALDNPLAGMDGSLAADLSLNGDSLKLSNGTLVIGGINQGFDAEIGIRVPRSLKLDAHFTTLGPDESAAIAALLPDVGADGRLAATFQKGEFNLSASKAVLFGLEGTGLVANAVWEGGVLEVSRLAAEDFGGAKFDVKLTAFGTLTKPELSGSGTLRVPDGAPAFEAALDAIKVPQSVQDYLALSLPANLTLQLDAPTAEGGQTLTATGKLGTATLDMKANVNGGVVNALANRMNVAIDLKSSSSTMLASQLGLGGAGLFPENDDLHLVANFDGLPSNSLESRITLEGGGDSIAFAGNIIASNADRLTGKGQVDASLADATGLANLLGAAGIHPPGFSGKATLDFVGTESLKLTDIEGRSGAAAFSGSLALARQGGSANVLGSLTIDNFDVSTLVPLLAGPSATVAGVGGVWPEGPFDIGPGPRATTGRIEITAPQLLQSGTPLLTDTRFAFDWDEQSIRLRSLEGNLGGGKLTFDAQVCCAGPLTGKRLNGRVAVTDVAFDALTPRPVGETLDGTITASAQFDGTGDSLAQAIRAMTGNGSYTVKDFAAEHFDPNVFIAVGALQNVVDMEPGVLEASVSERLSAGPFKSPEFTGSFTVAGGVLRSPNLAVENETAKLFGGVSLDLLTLLLDGRYAMTPSVTIDPASAVDPTTAEIDAVITGPLWLPLATIDTSSLVDGIKIKASEIELARLEELRAADEERRRLEAIEKARIAAELAAAEEARKKAEEEAAAKAAAEAAASSSSEPPPPIDLGL